MQLTPEELQAALRYPMQAPPAGVVSNFTNPETIAFQVYITGSVCILLMLVASLIRLLSATVAKRKIVIVDEVVFVVGLMLCLAFTAMTIACVAGGSYGRHAWDVLLGSFTKPQLLLSLLVEVVSPLAIGTVKVSVLILYLRGFGTLQWMRISCIVGIVVVVAYHASMCIAFGAMCGPSPTQGYSQLQLLAAFTSDACARTRILVVIQGIGNVVIDLFLVLLPLPAIWKLHLPLHRKMKTSALFMIGICACVVSVIGLAKRTTFYNAGADTIRLVVPIWSTAMAEMAAGVLVCCGPPAVMTYRALKDPLLSWTSTIRQRLIRLFSSGSNTYDSGVDTLPLPLLEPRPQPNSRMKSQGSIPRLMISGARNSVSAKQTNKQRGPDQSIGLYRPRAEAVPGLPSTPFQPACVPSIMQ